MSTLWFHKNVVTRKTTVYLNFGRIASALKIEAELTNSSVDLFFRPAQVGVVCHGDALSAKSHTKTVQESFSFASSASDDANWKAV